MDMSATVEGIRSEPAPSADFGRQAALVLVRIASGPADATTVARDTWRLASATLSADRWAAEVDGILERFEVDHLVSRQGPRVFTATPDGLRRATAFLGGRGDKALAGGWASVRDGALVAAAVGLAGAPAKRQKGIDKIDGLRTAIVVDVWGLKIKGVPSASRVRSALALVALERAFGNSVKGALGAKTDLSAKASRLLAAQLSKSPRDYGTDARLVAALAAEAVGVAKSDLTALRLGAIRRFISGSDVAAPTTKGGRRKPKSVPAPSLPESNEAERVAAPVAIAPVPDVSAPEPKPIAVVAPARPDPKSFAAAVLDAAAQKAEGWAGNRRAFISSVWSLVRERHPEWRISEIEFKSMLTEAHRIGLVVLANADLKDKRHLAEIQASAIPYKNTVWHYIRVEG